MADEDFLLALQLQEYAGLDHNGLYRNDKMVQEDKENQQQNKLVKSQPKPTSLIDPSWEMIDPTPDIHALFIQFNKTYFWDKLNAVEVRWSPRMTLCAGVCVYQGRAGLCSVRLSLPLLKLRPRKDLVETLLHEMIHAYLFVTHNNRDRDGHGPEFHKHMYRINDLAGTKISVYHSFHDEVKSYQQHWWRCNGPCQKRPPFFGMVRRSMNRAPGPTDNWYAEHQANCGGSFIKVREPDGYNKKKKDKALPSTSKGNLSNYFPSVNKNKGSDHSTSGGPKNVVGFGDFPSSTCPSSSSSSSNPRSSSAVNNVVGFKDLSGGSQQAKNPSKKWSGGGSKLGGGQGATGRPGTGGRPVAGGRPGTGGLSGAGGRLGGGAGGGMLANRGGGTLVVTGKAKKQDDNEPKTDLSNFTPFAGSGHVLGTKTGGTTSSVLGTKTGGSTSSVLGTKTGGSTSSVLGTKTGGTTSTVFGTKTGGSTSSVLGTKTGGSTSAVLGTKSGGSSRPNVSTIKSPGTNSNLSCWLSRPTDSRKRPFDSTDSGDSKSTKTEPKENPIDAVITLSDDEEPQGPKFAMVRCPLCSIEVSEIDVNIHLDECLANQTNPENEKAQDKDDIERCPMCDKPVPASELQAHVGNCIGDSFDSEDMNEMISGDGADQKECPVCSHSFTTMEMGDHLENCSGLQCSQNSLDLADDSDEEEDAAAGGSPQKGRSGGKLYPCPVCTKLFEEDSMNSHLDVCMSG